MAQASSLTRARRRTAWLYLTPMLIVLAVVAGWPLLRTFIFAFTDANLSDLGRYHFIGVENFYAVCDGQTFGLLADPEWWRAVWNTICFTVISVSLETVLGLVVALVLNQEFKGRGLVRAAVLIPWAIPTIVSSRMWHWMLHDQFGIINDLFLSLGFIDQPVAWTANPDTAMVAVIMVDVWKTTPFMALLTLAALQMLPKDCYDAAKVDGVNPFRVFFRVTLPLIRPALMVAVIFRALDALRVFDVIYVLTPNNPNTMTMSAYVRRILVDFQQVGYGSAAATLLFFVIAFCVMAYIMIGRVRLDEWGR